MSTKEFFTAHSSFKRCNAAGELIMYRSSLCIPVCKEGQAYPILTLAEDSASESASPLLLCAVLASAASAVITLVPSSLNRCLCSGSDALTGCKPRSLASGAEYLYGKYNFHDSPSIEPLVPCGDAGLPFFC